MTFVPNIVKLCNKVPNIVKLCNKVQNIVKLCNKLQNISGLTTIKFSFTSFALILHNHPMKTLYLLDVTF